MLYVVVTMIKNIVFSLLPGDKQRRYLQVNAAVNPEGMEKLRSMVEQKTLRVPIDSCWEMNDALKVRSTSWISFHRDWANKMV
jgi:hypothetical protein